MKSAALRAAAVAVSAAVAAAKEEEPQALAELGVAKAEVQSGGQGKETWILARQACSKNKITRKRIGGLGTNSSLKKFEEKIKNTC